MYNEKQKLSFIEIKKKLTKMPENCLENLFTKTEYFESRFNKDASCFTVPEIRFMYKMFNTSSANYLIQINNKLSIYTQWCCCQNLVPDHQNHYSELHVDMIPELINKLKKNEQIIRKEVLYGWLEELENPSEQFALLSLYEGIGGKELCEHVNLRLSDFNGNEVTLHTGKFVEDEEGNSHEILRTITVSDKLVHLAHQAADEDKYYIRHITNDGDVYYKEISYLPDKDRIYKYYPNSKNGVGTKQLGRRAVNNRLNRITKICEITPKLKVMDIITSGKINYIKERCEELGITGKDFLYSEHINEIKEQFGQPIGARSVFYNIYRDYISV